MTFKRNGTVQICSDLVIFEEYIHAACFLSKSQIYYVRVCTLHGKLEPAASLI